MTNEGETVGRAVHEAEQMRITIAAVLVLLTGAAAAEPLKLFYTERGQIPRHATGRAA